MKNINNDSRVSLEELTEIAEMTRDITHNLDLRDPESQKIFDEYSRRLFIALEGYYTSAYDDGRGVDPQKDSNLVKNILAAGEEIKGNITVGIGFNMDVVRKEGGRKEWEKALPGGKHKCRCWAEPVPEVEAIIEDQSVKMSKQLYSYDSFRILGLIVKRIEFGSRFSVFGMHTPRRPIWHVRVGS